MSIIQIFNTQDYVPKMASSTSLFVSDANWNSQKRLKAILTDQSTYLSKMDSIYIPVLKQLLTG
jgi:hypothetical protein